MIFRDPTSHIRVGAADGNVPKSLPIEQIQQTVAAAVRPAGPLIVPLATTHAARA